MNRSTHPESGYQTSFRVVSDAFTQTRELVRTELRRATLGLVMELYGQEVEELCGPRFSRKSESGCYRGGSDPSTVLANGQRIQTRKPRVKRDGRDVELTTHRALRDYDLLSLRIVNHMLKGVSSRDYDGLLEELEGGLGLKKSAVSKAFVTGSKEILDDINGRALEKHEWLAVMIDGIEFSSRHVIVALGITTTGKKLVLGLREGDTEDSEVVKDLIQNLIDRGLNRESPFLFVLDGSKALRKAIRQVFGNHWPVQRCTRHKERNALKYLPWRYHGEFRRKWKLIHGMTEYVDAKREYDALIAWLGKVNLEAQRSVEEAEGETLTVVKLGATKKLRNTLLSTNPIESAFDGVRSRTSRVKHWRKGKDQIARWAAATLGDMEKRFRSIPGHKEIPVLLEAMRRKDLIQSVEVA
jgi:putative transposase